MLIYLCKLIKNTLMFGDLLGNADKMQAEMRTRLKTIPVEVRFEGVTVSGTAAREVSNVTVDEHLLDPSEKEHLEDILVAGINRFIEKVTEAEAAESAQMMKKVLPPGFENLFK
jgi:nucleoid-associated protein EbfC